MPRRDLAHLSDEAVVALTARSDEVALAELYDRYGRIAYGLALRVIRDEALAEDAVQEAFLAIWRGASRFVPERAKAGASVAITSAAMPSTPTSMRSRLRSRMPVSISASN